MSLRQRMHIILFSGALALCPAWAQADALADVITAAQTALQQQDAERAYALLAEQEANYAGNVDFDYWFGLAAVRAGKPARATFALERVISEQPNHAGARLELATAWIQLGQRDAAMAELDQLEALSPPPQAQARIDALNQELNRQARSERQRRNGAFIGVEFGDDDNVGTWPAGLEFFPGFTIEAIDSTFASLKAGYWQRFDMSAAQKLTLSINGMARRNQEDDAEQFDQDYLTAGAEWRKDIDGRSEVAARLDLAMLRLDGEAYYDLFGVGGEWSRQLSAATDVTAGARVRQLDFELDQYDYLQTGLFGRVEHRPHPRWELSAEFNADYETADENRAGGDASSFGVSTRAWYQPAARHRVGAELGYALVTYRTDYLPGQAITPESGEREDDRLNASLLYDWFPGKGWQVRAQASYRDQSSSLDAFTYDQTVLSAGLNYYF